MSVSKAEAVSRNGGLIPGPGLQAILSDVLAAAPLRDCDAYAHGTVEEKACRVSARYIMSM